MRAKSEDVGFDIKVVDRGQFVGTGVEPDGVVLYGLKFAERSGGDLVMAIACPASPSITRILTVALVAISQIRGEKVK